MSEEEMPKTKEFYFHQWKMAQRELDSLRAFVKEMIATKGVEASLSLLRADRDRWKTIAESRASKLIPEYQKAAVEDTYR